MALESPMNISNTGIAFIEAFEGLELNAYRDPAGVWSIGYGHTLGVEEGMEITTSQAEALLLEDLMPVVNAINEWVNVPLVQHEFDALASFTFNTGMGAFKRSILLEKLNSDDREGAANEFPRWVRGGGRVLPGLVRRRRQERLLFLGLDQPPEHSGEQWNTARVA